MSGPMRAAGVRVRHQALGNCQNRTLEHPMRAADLMARKVLTVLPRPTVRAAAMALAGNGFTTLPVVDDDGVLVGVVTEADVIRNRIPSDPSSRRVAQPPAPTTVGEIMTA